MYDRLTVGDEASESDELNATSIDLFENLPFPVRQLTLLNPAHINTFEDARTVFLRAATRLEIAKQAFPLDG